MSVSKRSNLPPDLDQSLWTRLVQAISEEEFCQTWLRIQSRVRLSDRIILSPAPRLTASLLVAAPAAWGGIPRAGCASIIRRLTALLTTLTFH